MIITNYTNDVLNKLEIYKIGNNVSERDALKRLVGEYENDFDCVSSLTDIVTKPIYKITNGYIVAIIPVVRECDLFRFNKLQLTIDNVVIDNSFINKIQLVVDNKVIVEDLEKNNLYFPIVSCQGKSCNIQVLFDTKTIILPLTSNIILTCEKVWVNTLVRRSVVTQRSYDINDEIKKDNGLVVKKYEEKI